MTGNMLLLAVIGVMFCSGCTEQRWQRLEKLGATVTVNEQSEIIAVDLSSTLVTDAGLVCLEGLMNLEVLLLHYIQITDAGMVHLRG